MNPTKSTTMSFAFAAAAALSAVAAPAIANSPMAGTAAMAPAKTIVETAVGSPDHTTLVAAVKAAGLVDTLNSAGPFTVFAPTNAAFAKLPDGTVATLLKPENKAMLAKILTYHVVAGKVTATELIGMITAGGGSATLTTVAGGKLVAAIMGGKVMLTDEKGGMATVIAADLMAKNGVVHVTDTVSLPN